MPEMTQADRARSTSSSPKPTNGSTTTPSGLPDEDAESSTGSKGEFSVAVFHALSDDEEMALLVRLTAHGRSSRPARLSRRRPARSQYGGLGLSAGVRPSFRRAGGRVYDQPASHETHSVTTRLIAPTIMAFGDDAQREQFVDPLPPVQRSCAASCSPSPVQAQTWRASRAGRSATATNGW